ncbi:MAG: 30S ribosome-binding factor RbfA [Oscillospiraceae bacterium]|jgi:ribosome-binding factor A|nr:30S ribosome-binding factor RbfA [Oscillospiraceae bacterium]
MPSNKLNRANEDIKRVLSTLLREIKDPRIRQGLVSVTGVDTTGDLKFCKVYLSALGIDSEKEFLKGLKSASGYLRRGLASSLTLRNTPELIFELDKSIERGVRIASLIGELVPEETAADEDENADADETESFEETETEE